MAVRSRFSHVRRILPLINSRADNGRMTTRFHVQLQHPFHSRASSPTMRPLVFSQIVSLNVDFSTWRWRPQCTPPCHSQYRNTRLNQFFQTNGKNERQKTLSSSGEHQQSYYQFRFCFTWIMSASVIRSLVSKSTCKFWVLSVSSSAKLRFFLEKLICIQFSQFYLILYNFAQFGVIFALTNLRCALCQIFKIHDSWRIKWVLSNRPRCRWVDELIVIKFFRYMLLSTNNSMMFDKWDKSFLRITRTGGPKHAMDMSIPMLAYLFNFHSFSR